LVFRPRDHHPVVEGPADLAIATLIGCGSLCLYVATLCPTIYVEDSAEFATAAAVFGVPHPPGYPLYTLLSALFVRAMPVGDVGYRSNLFSAACGALAVSLLWVLLRRLGNRRVASLAGSLCFALGATFWAQCLASEVHALDCLLLVAALLVVSRATDGPSPWTFASSGFVLGLLIGHRNLNVVFAAPLFVLLEASRRRAGLSRRLLFHAAGAAVAATFILLYLPIAAARDPVLNVGSPSSLGRFWTVVLARSYFRHFAAAPAAVDLVRVSGFLRRLPTNLGIAAFAAPVGFVIWCRRTDRLPLVLAWMVVACLGFSALYNVLDVDSYLLPAIVALAVLATVGFDAWRSRLRVLLPLTAATMLPLNLATVDLRHVDIAGTYGRDLFRSAPDRAALISFGDTATHVCWYEQAVDHLRPDVVVISFDEVDDWYLDQLSRRHPDVDWPTTDTEPRWLQQFLVQNLAKRPICFTAPLDPALPDWELVPRGILFCLRPRAEPVDLAGSLNFWRHTVVPTAAELAHTDVHVQMVAFSYATARFALAGALARAGELASAKAQLVELVASDPDELENAVAAAMKTIGRRQRRPFSFGRRARQALLLDPNEAAFRDLLGS
jgi:hypothetical protein